MEKNLFRWKCFVVGSILLLAGTCVVPSAAKPMQDTACPAHHRGSFFGLNSNIELMWDANMTEEPIIPRGEIRTVPLTIQFWVTWGVFGRFINKLFWGHLVTLTLSIIDVPEWCTATLSQHTLVLVIPENENIYEMSSDHLSLQVDDSAPAFELFPVTIQATVEPLYGPFGFFQMMQGTTRVVNITFTVGYKPLIYLHLPEGNIIETPPLTQVELPIGIRNLGNGRTIVENEVVQLPDGWTVSIPGQLLLEVGDDKAVNLSIVAPGDFSSEEIIRVSFTPHSADDYSLVGQTVYITILVYYRPP